jgi:hypothetical protein
MNDVIGEEHEIVCPTCNGTAEYNPEGPNCPCYGSGKLRVATILVWPTHATDDGTLDARTRGR